MLIKTQKIIAKAISSKWLFIYTLLLFTAESSWLALTSRFPMAFDEIYHFGLIQFFSHRLNPIVTSQTAGTYKFGAIVQNPSFLYHYLLSFPDRFITIFTNNAEVHVVILRLINIGLALGSLLIMRKLLRLIRVSDALANVVVLAFALTPLITVLSSQINYDNLLILTSTLCVYETIVFTQQLNRRIFDAKRLSALLCLLLFSSLVKFSFLPVLVTLGIILLWKTAVYWRACGTRTLVAQAKKSYAKTSLGVRLALLTMGVLGSFLFVRFYGVNIVKYHNPVPQCNQVLSVQHCKMYYAWDNNYVIGQYTKTHPTAYKMSALHYSAFWLKFTGADLFGEIMPLQGPFYLSSAFYSIVIILTAAALVFTALGFRKMLRSNETLSTIILVSLVYLVFLWGRNYHDYLQLGQPVAINGRYWAPVLVYLYALLGLGVHYALLGRGKSAAAIKSGLALLVIVSFVCYGGYVQYAAQVSPVYGWINASNEFILPNN